MNHQVSGNNKDMGKSFNEMSETQLCDVILVAGNVEIPAHKSVLMGVSQYFNTMFTNFAEAAQDRIVMEEIDGKTLQLLIDYIYKAEVAITNDNVQDLLYVANYLGFLDLANACTNFLKNNCNPSNCLGIYDYAKRLECRELQSAAMTYVEKNFTDVVISEEFLSLTADQLIELISSKFIDISSEEQVFECVMVWVKSDLSRRKESIAKIMEHVKLPLLSSTYLQKIYDEPLFKDNIECLKYLDEAFSYNLLESDQKEDINSPRTLPRASKEKVLIITGRKGTLFIDCFCLKEKRRFRLSEYKENPRFGASVAAIAKTVYLLGGYHPKEPSGRKMIKFDCVTKEWSTCPDMNFHRVSPAVASLDNRLYVVGGDEIAGFQAGYGNMPIADVEVYNPNSSKWTTVASMNMSRTCASLCVVDGLLYAVGGEYYGIELALLESYCPQTDVWTMLAEMSYGRTNAGIVALNGLIYAIGGFINNTQSTKCEVYNVELNIWTPIADINIARAFIGVVAVNNLLYVVGSRTERGTLDAIEVYDPQSWGHR